MTQIGNLNFPIDPEVGDTFASGNRAWVYDGEKWNDDSFSAETDDRYVKKAGDAMTGLLTLSGEPVTGLGAVTRRLNNRNIRIDDSLDQILSFPVEPRANKVMIFDEDEQPALKAIGSFPPGPTGSTGPRGYDGADGEKGDPGNYVGISLIGSSTDIVDRPASATEGDAWGLIENGTIRIYIYSSSAWLDAGPLTTPTDFPIANTLFVSTDGNNANSGTSAQSPLLTIEAAVSVAQTRFNTNGKATLIKVGPGTYETDGHIDLPDNCGVLATHRTVNIVPSLGNEEKNVFRMGSGCFVEGFTFSGWRVNDMNDPTEGFAIAFRPGAVINRVPYAHKIVAYRSQPPSLVTAPLDRDNANPAVGNGMGVCIADGAVISSFSAFPNIMTWGATPSNPNGIGYVARNRALINAVNAVSLWCHKHHLCLGGGQIILSSCSTQFGDYSMWSEGYADILDIPFVTPFANDAGAAAIIAANKPAIINDMWTYLVTNSFTTGWTAQDEEFTRRDAAIFLDAVSYALTEGKQRAIDEFTRGMFKPVQDGLDYTICGIETVFDPAKEAAFVAAFEFMRNELNALLSAPSQTAVTNLTANLVSLIGAPVTRRSRSLITAIGHTWTYPLAGVTRSAVPPVLGGSGTAQRITRSVRQRKGGKVLYSGQDDAGNAVFVGGLRINARTGQLGGRPFDSAVELRAIEAAIASGV